MRAQTEAAVRSADVSLFVVDARAGLTPLDRHFAELLRALGKPIVLVANKAESRASDAGILETYALGFGDPVAISAEHGQGLGDLHDAILVHAGEAEVEEDGEEAEDEDRPIRVAVVGRPNAGKSTLINRMIGEDRLLTGPEAGITRDSISIDWRWGERDFRLFDTAGLRRKARVEGKLEKLAVGDALRAVRFAEVVILVLDVGQPFEKQDLQIADLVESEGRAIVIALDKWDLVTDRQRTMAGLKSEAERLLPQIAGVALVPVSGVTGEGIDRLMEAVLQRLRAVEPPRGHRATEPLAAGNPRTASAAGGRRAARQAALPDPGQGAPADLRRVLLKAGSLARRLAALPGQCAARGFQASRCAHPPDAAQGRQPLRGAQAQEELSRLSRSGSSRRSGNRTRCRSPCSRAKACARSRAQRHPASSGFPGPRPASPGRAYAS